MHDGMVLHAFNNQRLVWLLNGITFSRHKLDIRLIALSSRFSRMSLKPSEVHILTLWHHSKAECVHLDIANSQSHAANTLYVRITYRCNWFLLFLNWIMHSLYKLTQSVHAFLRYLRLQGFEFNSLMFNVSCSWKHHHKCSWAMSTAGNWNSPRVLFLIHSTFTFITLFVYSSNIAYHMHKLRDNGCLSVAWVQIIFSTTLSFLTDGISFIQLTTMCSYYTASSVKR